MCIKKNYYEHQKKIIMSIKKNYYEHQKKLLSASKKIITFV